MSTDGFYTACTTCSARLKVRDLSAIGQIFACPKCGSMVMVEAPEGMELPIEEAASPQDAPAETVPESTGLKPADWATASASGSSWLPIAFGSVVAVLVLGGVATFAWLRLSQPATTQVAQTLNETENRPAVVNELGSDTAIEEPSDDVELPLEPQSVAVINEPGQPVTDDVKVDEIFGQVTEETNTESTPTPDLLSDPTITPSLTQESIPATESTRAAESPATLSNLANLLSGSPNSGAPNATEPANETTEDVEIPPASPAISDSAVASSTTIAKRRNITKALEDRIPAVRFDKTPLGEFVRTMMQLSGVPIQLDPAALEQTNNRVDTPVSVASIDKSVGEILQQSLKPLNLLPIIENNSVRISSRRLEDTAPMEAVFRVADLLAGKGKELDLAHLVSTLIEPQSWSTSVAADGRGAGTITLRDTELQVTNARRVSIKTLVLLEKLRAARGLKPQKKIPAHLVTLQPRWSNIERYMRRPVNFDVWRPSPWMDVMIEIERVTGLNVIVDWQGLAQVGIGSETIASLHARETRVGVVLDDFLDAHDLALIPVDGRTVQLTSKSKMMQQPYIEFYAIKRLGDDRMGIVEQLMLNGKAALDSASEFALVVADSSTHQRLAN